MRATFPGTDGLQVLWEHRQEGIVLPRQAALRDSEVDQGLQEE